MIHCFYCDRDIPLLYDDEDEPAQCIYCRSPAVDFYVFKSYELKRCPACEGRGWEVFDTFTETCHLCEGQGYVDLAQLHEEVRLRYFSCIIPQFLRSSSQASRE